MQITKRQVRPDALAAELTDALQQHKEEVSNSTVRYNQKRESVVLRATDRVQAVRELQSELKTEEQALKDLIRAA